LAGWRCLAALRPFGWRRRPGRPVRIEKALRLWQGGDELHVTRSFTGVAKSGLQPDTGVRRYRWSAFLCRAFERETRHHHGDMKQE
jgi:hypothetical protein